MNITPRMIETGLRYRLQYGNDWQKEQARLELNRFNAKIATKEFVGIFTEYLKIRYPAFSISSEHKHYNGTYVDMVITIEKTAYERRLRVIQIEQYISGKKPITEAIKTLEQEVANQLKQLELFATNKKYL